MTLADLAARAADEIRAAVAAMDPAAMTAMVAELAGRAAWSAMASAARG